MTLTTLGDTWAEPPGPAQLGEGPVWSVREQALYWVDILAPQVNRWVWGAQQIQSWPLPSLVGALALRRHGGLIVAMRTGIHALDLTDGSLRLLADPEADRPGTRYNDGTVDPAGRFWIGGMVLEGEPDAAGLHRIEADGTVTTALENIGCGNGIGFSPDGHTMYYTDTATRTIRAFDFDSATGELSNPRNFVVDTDCDPDGLTVDADGFVWGAKWDGARLVRYAPDGGLDRVVELPVPRPTSMAFGGPDLRTLFVTSACVGLSTEQLTAAPLSGQVLVIGDVGVAGLPEPVTLL